MLSNPKAMCSGLFAQYLHNLSMRLDIIGDTIIVQYIDR